MICFLTSNPAALMAGDGGTHYSLTIPGSDQPDSLAYEANYYIWIPENVKHVRGIIVHQHGCGEGAEKSGLSASHDLHWQALARKWDCALLATYYKAGGANCRTWCDSRNGSEKTYIKAIDMLAKETGHTELSQAPWCLWGHSGGGFWASLMQTTHPDKIVAIWLRSGTAYSTWEKGEIPKPEIKPEIYNIPVVCNPGHNENNDKRFAGAWTGSLEMFKAYRAQGALICFAPDPFSGHDCGTSRLLAIPFFDACLAARLPDVGAKDQSLKPMPKDEAWLAAVESDAPAPIKDYKEDPLTASWLPNQAVALKYAEYIKKGVVSDTTPPPAPIQLKLEKADDTNATLSWEVQADIETGVSGFEVMRDGQTYRQILSATDSKKILPTFQGISFHDTPMQPIAELKITLPLNEAQGHTFSLKALNGNGLSSAVSSEVTLSSTSK